MKQIYLAALCVACFSSCGGPASPAGSPPTKTHEAKFVRTVPARAHLVSVGTPATGTFTALESSNVAPELEGFVAATPVEVGAFVRAGAELVRLNPTNAQQRLDQALASEAQALASLRQMESKAGGAGSAPEQAAEVAAAKANLEAAAADLRLAEQEETRAQNLLRSGDVSRAAAERAKAAALGAKSRREALRQQYQVALNTARQDAGGVAAAQAGLAAAKSQTAAARKALDNTIVRSPFEGFVAARPIAKGEYVSPQTKVAVIERIHPIRLLLQMTEADFLALKLGLAVKATTAAHPGREFLGKVTAIHPALTASSRSLTVEAQFPNEDSALRPGMFAAAQVDSGGSREVVAVPAHAVEEDKRVDSRRVWVVEKGIARLRLVELVTAPDPAVRYLSSGVKPGEFVVVSGSAGLFEGAVVRQ